MPTTMPWAELAHGFTCQTSCEPPREVGKHAARSKLRFGYEVSWVIVLNISWRSMAAKVLAHRFMITGAKSAGDASSKAGKSPRRTSRRSTSARPERSQADRSMATYQPRFLVRRREEPTGLPDLAERDWPTVNDPELDHIEVAHSANRLSGTMYPPRPANSWSRNNSASRVRRLAPLCCRRREDRPHTELKLQWGGAVRKHSHSTLSTAVFLPEVGPEVGAQFMVPAWGESTNGIALHPSGTARSRRENLAQADFRELILR